MKKLTFLGSGNMAAAIGRGLAGEQAAFALKFYDLSYEKAQALAAETGGEAAASLEEAVAAADIVLLAVKPQSMGELLGALAPKLAPGQLVLTIAAGLPLEFYEQRLSAAPAKVPMIRIMPNTSAAVLAAISGLMAGKYATEEHKQLAEAIFAAVGRCVWLPEEQVHALTAISGSGPAYFYAFCEAMAKAGESLGLAPEVAAALARQTAIGAGRMLEARDEEPAALREQVTSKGGTTAAALAEFGREQELDNLVGRACEACAKRSREMAEELDCR